MTIRAAGRAQLAADAPLGALLRLPLRLIRPGTQVPILATRARGLRWISGAGPHSCWLGFNELRKRRLFERVVRPGTVVWDVGANVGSYTMLASACTGSEGSVVAFEPDPENLRWLREHLAINGLGNVRVIEAAVTDRTGRATFRPHADRLQGRLEDDGPLAVDAVTLDDFANRESGRPPHCIKIDIEGGEAAALMGGRGVLSTERPIVFVATHGDAVHAECVALLESLDYDVATIGDAVDELIARPRTR